MTGQVPWVWRAKQLLLDIPSFLAVVVILTANQKLILYIEIKPSYCVSLY